MRSDHIISGKRTYSLSYQGCHTGNKSIDHHRNMHGCTAKKHTCHSRNIQSSYFCKHIYRILRIRTVQSDCFFDGCYFSLQSLAGKTGSASGHCLYRLIQKN